MNKSNNYSPEVRARAIRLVQVARKDYTSQWAAVESIAPKLSCAAVTLHECRRSQRNTAMASAFFAQAELDRLKKK